jgi:hypothetical protein
MALTERPAAKPNNAIAFFMVSSPLNYAELA